MKIIFMGNPAIACPILGSLCASDYHDLIAVVSNAPKTMGRGQSLRHTAVGKYAIEKNLNFIPAEFTFITKNQLLIRNPISFMTI